MNPLKASNSKPLEGGPSFPIRHRIIRSIWSITWHVLAAWTPAPLHRWRVWLLNMFGARVHSGAHVYGSARIWYPANLTMAEGSCLGPEVTCYSMALISLGQGAIVSQGVYLCAGMHDIEDPHFQLLAKPIRIGDGAWLAAEAFVGPGVAIGHHAVIGARTVIFRDAVAGGVYVGNPAVLIKKRLLESS
jgi:putative colanic acid biosynthesis acetyltransferase WcaF